MNKEINVLFDGIASKHNHTAEPAHRTTSDSEAVLCEGEVEKAVADAPPPPHQIVTFFQGTPPSNTVPPNDKNKHFKALLFGIDSLYLSYYGQLAEDWDKKLFELKENAQSEDEKNQALAQVAIRICLKFATKACRVFLMFCQITVSSSN